MADEAPLLHCAPYSYYSQKALFALAEKGVTPQVKYIEFSTYGQYAPSFMKLNPKGQVPVLQHDNKTVADSKAITNYVDKTFGGPSLHTDPSTPLGNRVQEWVGLIDSLAIPTLTYGSAFTPELTTNVLFPEEMTAWRKKGIREDSMRKALERFQSEAVDPEIRALYEAKLATPPPYPTGESTARDAVYKELVKADELFEKIEQRLAQASKDHPGKPTWLLAEHFTAADISLAVLLQRFTMIGFAEREWGGRPLVAKYRDRLIAEKPNFVKVCVSPTAPPGGHLSK